MKAIYDNEQSGYREMWVNGSVSLAVTVEFLRDAAVIAPAPYGQLLEIGPWNPGQIIGDKEAMNRNPSSRELGTYNT
jgi:hypothetical protein